MQMQFQSRSGFPMRCDNMFSPISLNSLQEEAECTHIERQSAAEVHNLFNRCSIK